MNTLAPGRAMPTQAQSTATRRRNRVKPVGKSRQAQHLRHPSLSAVSLSLRARGGTKPTPRPGSTP